MLLCSGDRVYVDKSSVVGGLEVGEIKILRGRMSEYISNVTYAQHPSYVSEMKKDGEFN